MTMVDPTLPHCTMTGIVTTVAARKLFQTTDFAGPTYLSVTEEGLRIKAWAWIIARQRLLTPKQRFQDDLHRPYIVFGFIVTAFY
jgi:hypothetical protein